MNLKGSRDRNKSKKQVVSHLANSYIAIIDQHERSWSSYPATIVFKQPHVAKAGWSVITI